MTKVTGEARVQRHGLPCMPSLQRIQGEEKGSRVGEQVQELDPDRW